MWGNVKYRWFLLSVSLLLRGSRDRWCHTWNYLSCFQPQFAFCHSLTKLMYLLIVCDPLPYCSSKFKVSYRVTYFLLFLCQSLIISLTSDKTDSLRNRVFWNKKKNFKSYSGEIEGHKVCIMKTNTHKFKVMRSYIQYIFNLYLYLSHYKITGNC